MAVGTFRESLGKKFNITVEICPPKGVETRQIIEKTRSLKGLVDALNVADSPMAHLRMSPIPLSYIIKKELGIETIFHLTCRDRNIIGLQSELLGAYALGLENVFVITGDDPSVGDNPNAKPIFEVDAIGLIKLINKLNNGSDFAGNKLETRPNFLIGCAVNFNKAGEEERMKKKIEEGALFFQSQIVYDAKVVEDFLSRIEKTKPIFVGTMPFNSWEMVQYMDKYLPGIKIPEKTKSIMKNAKNVEEASAQIVLEFFDEIKGLVQGLHIMPLGDIELAKKIIKEIR
ncbi:MAG: methylenetetrahydrofolate reductase [Candidatus Thermoplasmatota archaeon]